MFWKLLTSLLYLSTVQRNEHHQHHQIQHQHEHQQHLQLPPYFRLTEHGPQTLEEYDKAFEALYSQNDMLFPEHEVRSGIKDTKYRWPKYQGRYTVPYVIDSALFSQTQLIERAMEQYNKLTCLRFVKRTTEKDYIKLVHEPGCQSYVGRRGGEQRVKLGDGCHYIGTIVHELGHAIGLYHEHQRSDRDKYLTVYEKNVTAGLEHNFKKTPVSEELILTPFNHNSIMIYGNYAFSKSRGHLMTMEAKNGKQLFEPYTKPGLDTTDITEVKKLYKC